MTDLGAAERFAVGTVGPPGKREFYLQVGAGATVRSFLLEKAQVAALALRARELLASTDPAAHAPPDGFDPPGVPNFRVRAIRIGYVAEGAPIDIELHGAIEEEETFVRFTVTAHQLDAVSRTGLELVESGRTRCPKCGLAMDPNGHPCPAGNGDLRNHQP